MIDASCFKLSSILQVFDSEPGQKIEVDIYIFTFHLVVCCCRNSFKKEDFLTDFEYLSLSLCSEGREMAFVKFHTLQNITIHTFGIASEFVWILFNLFGENNGMEYSVTAQPSSKMKRRETN